MEEREEETVGEMGGISDTDSDETVIEGSVAESALEEEEFYAERLSLIGRGVESTTHSNFATEIKDTNREEPSPESQLICKKSTYTEMLKYPEEIILQYSEDEKEESQSILQVGIICPVISTDVCQSDCPSSATEPSVGLEMAGFLETSEKNVLQVLNGDVPSETCSGTDTVKVGGDSILRCPEISDIFQSITMTNKEDTAEKNLSPEIQICNNTKGRRMAEMADVEDVREALGDFDSQIMSPVVVDMLEYWNDAHYMDASVNEENCALPVELSDLNCLTESFAVYGDQAMEKESVHSPGKKPLMPDQRDDCTQITDTNFKPTFHLDIHEETEILSVTKLSCNSEQQLDCDQHNYKLVLSEHQSIRPAVLNEISSSEQTIQETSYASRKSARKRGNFIPDGAYATVDSYRFLEGLYQKKQRHKARKKLPSKNSETHEPGLKDKGDQCSQSRTTSSCGSLSYGNGRVEQMRKSQRIAKKKRKQTTSKKYLNDSASNCISLSSINRRDIFGQTLLHRAVIKGDLDHIRAVIKSGANVNAKDYAGWTALHEASLVGFFEATNELLQADAEVNCKGQEQVTPLHDAVKEGHYKVAELLLWYGADPLFKHEKGKCALEETTDKQMKKLLESYIPKSTRSSTSDCSYSKEKEKASSSQQMSTKASRVNKRNAKGKTCLHLAAKKGNLSLVKSLIASGACVNQKDNAGWMAIHEASIGGFVDITLELLKAGAEVNSKGLNGVLPIHDAVSGNHFEVVQFLLDHGADPNETDNSGENAMDKATCDKMKEFLKSYAATGTKKTSGMNDVASGRELSLPHSRKPRYCHDCYGKDDLSACLNATKQKSRTQHESISDILQSMEKKQNKLLFFELRNQRDADLYIQDLSQIQNILNEVLAKQKSERNDLAKKYRASVESFKQGALREQLVKLVSRQKSLLHMAQKQKELGQKVQNYKKAKNESLSLAKRIPSTSSSCERNSTKDGTSDKTPQCPDVAVGMESTLVMESSFLDQEHNQNPNVSLNEGNGTTVSQNAVASHNEVSKKKEYATDNISDFQLSSAVDQATLPSEPICFIQTKPSQLKETDCESVGPGKNTPPAAVPVTCELNISETTNISVSSVNQQTALVCMNETFQQHSCVNETYQTQKITNLESIHSCLSTSQKNMSDNRTSLNASLGLPGVVSSVPSPSGNSQDGSNCSAKQDSENQFSVKPKRRKKTQLLDLIEQGKIKPGDNVLEFTLQDFNHKASLLGNGKVKTGNNTIYQSPVQWIKALLGNDISVSWKYVWNKVTYCGTLLSKIVAEVHILNESLQPKKPVEPPHQPILSKELRFLQFNELVLIEDEEFLPQHEMDQYWNLYIHCENFGFETTF